MAESTPRVARQAPKFLLTTIQRGVLSLVRSLLGSIPVANRQCDSRADEPTTRNSYFLPFNLNFITSLSSVN